MYIAHTGCTCVRTYVQYVEMYCVCVPYIYVCMYTRTYVHTYIHTYIHTPFTEHTVLHKLHALFQLENFFKGGKDMSQGIRGRGRGMEANLCVCMCVST